ncbi:MAG: DUF1576 domain-containing protein [Clostridiaceae bacterium]|jgi:hypothetical protein|nr:DUF1576 domain-containing protein [Clostridiaceae bacterium]
MAAAEATDRNRTPFLLAFATLLTAAAFLFNPADEILRGSLTILTSPANLITDYFALANPGAALLNAGVMSYLAILVIHLSRVRVTGPLVAAVFTMAGFSLFGKNLLNSIPIMAGVYLYALVSRTPFDRYLLQALFGTALGPLFSEIAFHLGLAQPLGLLLGFAASLFAGFVLTPLSMHMLRFHQGFNLYNIGFTAGIIGMFFIAVLRNFGIEIGLVNQVSSAGNLPYILLLGILFLGMLVAGLCFSGWRLTGYGSLLRQSGRLAADFVTISGFGLTLVNMAVLGILSTGYVLLVGGRLSGPVIGGIFTVVGFGAFGKHPRNVWPILFGVFLMGLVNHYEIHSTVMLLAALFGTTLAPISGHYGPFVGILAGMLHTAMVMNIGDLHAGMNLYNNGFSGGFIAAAMVPILDGLKEILAHRKKGKPET